jgi:hypothetical protein
VRFTRAILWAATFSLAANACHDFPQEPLQRAAVVCSPIQWLISVSTAIASAMDDRGRVGHPTEAWRQDLHRSCQRIAERIFSAAGS